MVKFVNLAEIMGQVDNARARDQGIKMNQILMQRQQRQFDMEDETINKQKQLKDVYAGAYDPTTGKFDNNKILQGVSQVDPMKGYEVGQQMESQSAANQKAQFEAQKEKLAFMADKAKYGRDILATVTPETYPQIIQQLQAEGFSFALNAPTQFDPNWVESNVMNADSFIKKAADELKAERDSLTQPFMVKDGQLVPNTQVQEYEKSLKRAGASNVSVNTGQKGFDNTLKLRGDFRGEPIYKAHQDVKAAYSQITAALKQASPAGDLAGATKIMKILDPGSVVRESELGMAMAANGLLDRLTNYAQMTINGTKLTPAQRKDFQNLADVLYQESINQYNSKRNEYKGIVDRNDLNEADVLGEPDALPIAPTSNDDWSMKRK